MTLTAPWSDSIHAAASARASRRGDRGTITGDAALARAPGVSELSDIAALIPRVCCFLDALNRPLRTRKLLCRHYLSASSLCRGQGVDDLAALLQDGKPSGVFGRAPGAHLPWEGRREVQSQQ